MKKFKSISFFLVGFIFLFANLANADSIETKTEIDKIEEAEKARAKARKDAQKKKQALKEEKEKHKGIWKIFGDCHRCQDISSKTSFGAR